MLHHAAQVGSVEGTVYILSRGSIDINEAQAKGYTPLMLAAGGGHFSVVRILLDKGADVSISADGSGYTALHVSAQHGHLVATKMLMEAGAALEATDGIGCTPLYAAAHGGHREVMRALIEAGANPNSRMPDGETPLFGATFKGHVQSIRELLRAKADPSLAKTFQQHPQYVMRTVPLDNAAARGHSDVVHELIRQVGIGGCGGRTGGHNALYVAAENGHIGTMAILVDAGVVDTHLALICAAENGQKGAVKFLLQCRMKREILDQVACVNSSNHYGQTPLLASIFSCSPGVGRLLIDTGADTISTVRCTNVDGETTFNGTPLDFASHSRREMVKKKTATEEKLHGLEAIRRLLLQVDAVHAVSWLWPVDFSAIAHAAQSRRMAKTGSIALTVVLPIARRRARRRGVLLAALSRCVVVNSFLVQSPMQPFA